MQALEDTNRLLIILSGFLVVSLFVLGIYIAVLRDNLYYALIDLRLYKADSTYYKKVARDLLMKVDPPSEPLTEEELERRLDLITKRLDVTNREL